MRIRIRHETVYSYQPPAKGVIQILRLTPRDHNGQYVVRWRVDVSGDQRLVQREDAFGNVTHTFTAGGPLESLRVEVEGEVETQDTTGVIRNCVERFPPSLFLRDTPLTTADAAIAEFAGGLSAVPTEMLASLHQFSTNLRNTMTFDSDPTHAATSAADAFHLKRGVCQDYAQIMIAACRAKGIPARYISGYLRRSDGVVSQEAGHAWMEAYVPDLGWVGFDPTHAIAPTDAYVRLAVGLDYLGAAPVRGTRFGGGAEQLDVSVKVQAADQVQS
jgi:transglutaminase-like putative cysteine protease